MQQISKKNLHTDRYLESILEYTWFHWCTLDKVFQKIHDAIGVH